jgi:hypothetical protein
MHGPINVKNSHAALKCHYFLPCGVATQRGSWPPHSWGFLDQTQRRTTVGRTPLDEWSARRRNLYLTTHNTHNRQTSMPPVGFEPTISAGQLPQTYTLDRAVTGTGIKIQYRCQIWLHQSKKKYMYIFIELKYYRIIGEAFNFAKNVTCKMRQCCC